MVKIFDIKSWVDDPEKRMRLVRISSLLALGMMVFGFILIIMSFFYPNLI